MAAMEEQISSCLMHKRALQQYNKDMKTSVCSLKPLQIQAVKSYLAKDTLVILPTGYGKSLTYELLPYLDSNCLLIIIVPVDAIIIQELEKLGNTALLLSTETLKNLKEFEEQMKSCHVKYVFAHPEITRDKSVRKVLCTVQKKVYIVVDEAHCLEMWGEHFRPAFRSIGELRSVFTNSTMIAMTATLSPVMMNNLKAWLRIAPDFHHVATCPIRENLYLEVGERSPSTGKLRTAEDSYEAAMSAVLKEVTDNGDICAVIYCTLHWCQFGHELFRRQMGEKFWLGNPENVTVAQYHASLSAETKKDILQRYNDANSALRILFATVSLGMGADLHNVDRVYNIGPPSSVEMYVQQIGRAGRGNMGAKVTLMVTKSDLAPNVKGLTEEMRQYCQTTDCRRRFLCKFFGYNVETNASNCCDNCDGKTTKITTNAMKNETFVPDAMIIAIENNLRHYSSVDETVSQQLTSTIIRSIAKSCKTITDYRQLSAQYSLDDHVARSVYAIVMAIIQHQEK